jgi:D-alanyl-D-alanine carboxypeptidase/D-alanyl-D-alanine-endopeptidase (penicillin-binding protein 4)
VLALGLAGLSGHAPPASAGPPDPETEEAEPPAAAPVPVDPSAPPPAHLDTSLPLGTRLDTLLAADFLADARVGVHVVEAGSGKVVYAKNPALALNPASNAKLFTTAAALWLLGPEHRYVTRAFVGRDTLEAGVVSGPIHLQGSGDPALVTGELYELALRIRASGIKRIEGGVVVDASRFDADRLPPGFDQKDELASYRAPMGATSVNFNTYEVLVHPGAGIGAPVLASIAPDVASIRVESHATTADGFRNRLAVTVEDQPRGKILVTVRGTLGLDAGMASYRYPVLDPATYAGEVFVLVAGHAGIRMGRKTVTSGPVPDGARLVGQHRSQALGVLVRAVNKLSNNFMAEQILRTLAPEAGATAVRSLEALRAWTVQAGIEQEGLHLGNGSGLYDNNRVSAAQVTRLLTFMHSDFRYRGDFLASLATLGVDGTLRRRLADATARRWVRGKTGTLDGVSALSGYVGAVGRPPVAFSILMNDLGRWETAAARDVQDRIVEALAADRAG